MFGRNRAIRTAAVCLAVFALAITARFAYADTITDTGVILNDQGVLVPSGYDPAQVVVTRVEPNTVSSPFRFVSPLIDILFVSGSTEIAVPVSLTYVYFNMNHIERAAWDEGRAGIYFQAENSSLWTSCSSTFLVSGANLPDGRLACIAPQSAVYGLGILEVPAALVPGALVSPGVETASFMTANLAQTGNQGVFAPNGINADQIAIRMIEPGLEEVPDMTFEARRLLIRIDWIGDELPVILPQGQEAETETTIQSEPAGLANLTYVFYVLDRVSRAQWDEGHLSIYYYDAALGAWQTCGTTLAEDGANGTVSCLASQFTYYALGFTGSSAGEE